MESEIKIEFYPKEKLKKEILEILGKYLNLKKYKVFFFGSRVEGKNSPRADIDIGIEGEKALSLETLAEIKEEIEKIPTLYKIDIVDFKSVDKDFYQTAKEKIEFIN